MTHKIIKTDNYLLVVDNSVHPYDSSKVGNPLAHLPLNGSPILKDVLLLPPIEDDFEKFLDRDFEFGFTSEHTVDRIKWYYQTYFKEKYKYTEKDIRKAIDMATTSKHDSTLIFFNAEEIIQHLHQYPTEFECEMVGVIEHKDGLVTNQYEIPKTITTSQGVQWVGKYK
jgi:hypothetical protein